MVEIYSQHPDSLNQQLIGLPLQESCSARLLTVAAPAYCTPHQYHKILRMAEVTDRVGLSRASIYRRITSGIFPPSISLGLRAVGWLESEIDAWLTARMQQARGDKSVLTKSKALARRHIGK
jgi:prophage regulatory protein